MAALSLTANNSAVNCGSGASLDNVNQGTYLFWIFLSSITASAHIFAKGRFAVDASLHSLSFPFGDGNLAFFIQGSTDFHYITDDDPVATGSWQFVAVTGDVGTEGHIYVGDRSTLAVESTYGTSVNGATAGDDSARVLELGSNVANQELDGTMGFAAVFKNDVLTLGEIHRQQFRPHNTATISGMWWPGMDGATSVPDRSGNGNNGTAAGGVLVDGLPLGPPFGYEESDPYVVAAAASTVPVLDEGMLTGGFQPLGGGLE